MIEQTMDRGVGATQAMSPHASAVSWAAIFAGALGSAALSLILLVLGVGLGLSSVSPWSQEGLGATAFGISTIVWITLTSLLVSGLGGFIAGRLRSRWLGVERDEVYFRDTAHGFLAWAVATLLTAAVLTSAIGSIVGTGLKTGASVAGAAGTAAMAAGGGAAAAAVKSGSSGNDGGGLGYYVDSLFRKDAAASGGDPNAANGQPSTSEVTAIFAQSLKNGSISQDDVRYVGQLVAQRTGLSQQDAEKRVNDLYGRAKGAIHEAATKAREAADAARKATAYASLWLFVSLLIGAFSASLAATWGGRRRDL